MFDTQTLELAGVPVVVHPPAFPNLSAPLIVLWHGFGIPNNEEILAKTLPLENVQAWKAYLGLPLFGKRLPVGGLEEIMQRQLEDYVTQLLLPVIEQAMQELPNVIEALQARLDIDNKAGIGMFGFSAGGLAALLSLVETQLPIRTVVLAGVTKDLVSAVETFERATRQYYPTLKEQFPWVEERHTQYRWTEASQAAKQRLDFVARAFDIVKRKPMPAILFVHAAQDEAYAVSDVENLYAALATYYKQANRTEHLSIKIFDNLKHHLDLEAAKNSSQMQQDITELQQTVAEWFNQYLISNLSRS